MKLKKKKKNQLVKKKKMNQLTLTFLQTGNT